MNDSQRWQRVKEIFDGALELHGAERAAFLDRACGGDTSVRKEVESLLRSYEVAGSFMEAPAVAQAADDLATEQKLNPGQRIRHYQIVNLIGEGGMGEVYLATDTILGRRIALKVLPAFVSKDPERLRRFTQEARAASRLSHPNVLCEATQSFRIFTDQRGQHFQCDTTTENRVGREIDLAHPAFADEVHDLVVLDALSGIEFLLGREIIGGLCDSGRFHEAARDFVRTKQRFDFFAHTRVAVTGAIEKPLSFGAVKFECTVKDFFDSLPALRIVHLRIKAATSNRL